MSSVNGHTRSSSGTFLSEEYIQDAFHSYLKSSLTQAKIERLLDAEVLSSAEGDLMITGPALCLYFAALRCTTNPPSVPLPRFRKDYNSPPSSEQPTDLSTENCPPAFRSFLSVWAHCVPTIQALTPEHQHDLARVICSLDPLSTSLSEDVYGIAADLRAVAIEISQRRSFQDRYAADLQAALDSGGAWGPASSGSSSPGGKKASFVPPPSYEDSSPGHSPGPSPQPSPNQRSSQLPAVKEDPRPSSLTQYAQVPPPVPPKDLPPQDTSHLSPFSPIGGPSGSGWPSSNSSSPPRSSSGHRRSSSVGRSTSPSPSRISRISTASTATSTTLHDYNEPSSPPFPVPQIPLGHGTYYPPHIPVPTISSPPSPPRNKLHKRNHSAASAVSTNSYSSVSSTTPSIITDSPSIDIIRETLYAALADVLATHPSLRALIKTDPSRAYFGSVSLAILDVSVNAVTPNGTVRGVLGTDLTLDECPSELRPFMMELGGIARSVKEMEEHDNERAIEAISEGREPPTPRLERVRQVLEEGIGGSTAYQEARSGTGNEERRDRRGRTRSPSGRAVAFANKINGLALGMTRLKAFRERQGEVFKVLAGAGR